MDDYNERFTSKITLHSNLVLFKFHFPSRVRLPLLFFTFQSGSIQICRIVITFKISSLYIPIWFYSNYKLLYKSISAWKTLHSNLVLFKLLPALSLAISICTFTFQSGSIQIQRGKNSERVSCTLHSNLVLFKYRPSS